MTRAFRCGRTDRWPTNTKTSIAVTGTATTGHEWDGIHELNTPLPRWWLWTFYACIVWAVGYWVVYPAWPLLTNSTQGITAWHARSAVVGDLDELKALRGPMMEKLTSTPVADIVKDAQLLDFARAQGRVGVRRQLRALPRRRRRRRQGLSQPQRRRLAVGRQARRDRADHPPRRALGRRERS